MIMKYHNYMNTRLEIYKKSHEVYFDKDKTYMRRLDDNNKMFS